MDKRHLVSAWRSRILMEEKAGRISANGDGRQELGGQQLMEDKSWEDNSGVGPQAMEQ